MTNEKLPGRLMTMEEIAARLRISRWTLRGILKRAPYYRLVAKRRKVFTEDDFQQIVEALKPEFPARPAAAFEAGPSHAAVTRRLAALLKKPERKPAAPRRGKRDYMKEKPH